jgi:ubiquinone/menaquinone biosynthesis C-methylase UbiE
MKEAEFPPPPAGSERSERERLARVYEGYAADPHYQKVWSTSPASSFMASHKWAVIASLLKAVSIDLLGARVLDLGAGEGTDCARFGDLGVQAGHLVALDILEDRARRARRSHSTMQCLVGDAARLPFRDASFNIVYQSTMLSSVLETDRRERILGEVRRVLGRGGVFLSYDTRYPNPRNRNTRPVRPRELATAFVGWPMRIQSLTPLPQLVRLLAPYSLAACRALEAIPPLRSHNLALVRKP